MLQDFRFALRLLNRHRGYAAMAILTVALGVGANTAVRDASTLTRWLSAVDRGEWSVSEASEKYQAEMLGYATEAVATSLQVAKWSLQRIDFDESELAA